MRSLLPVLRAAVSPLVDVRAQSGTESRMARIDRAEFEQVVLNLVVNARDAGAKSVSVITSTVRLLDAEIATSEIVGDVTAGDYTVLEVADDGQGMSPQLASRIFDPFFTTRFPGRGLGLAVVLGAVRRRHGGIAVESEVGVGSRFKIYLPTVSADCARQPVPNPEPPSAAETRGTVMVVDDDPSVRRLLATTLREAGHNVLDVGSGKAAIEALASLPTEPTPLLLLDVTMPEMDGTEVMARVRATHPQVPIVLMSGHTSSYVEEVAQTARPDGLLLKPFDLNQMREVIATTMAAAASRQNRRNVG